MIQRATRRIGDIHALFYIGLTGGIVLLPFVWQELPNIFSNSNGIILLLVVSVITVIASLFDFEALKEGKISIINPITGLELPITVALSIFLLGDWLGWLDLILILAVFIGIALASFGGKLRHFFETNYLERGVILALVSAITMALLNFFVGVSSEETSPLLTIWFSFLFAGIFCLIIMFFTGTIRDVGHDLRHNPKLIIAQCSLDTLGWVAFAQSTTFVSIAITTTISEAYVALSALLGLWVGREKLATHQKIGIAITVAGVLILSALVP